MEKILILYEKENSDDVEKVKTVLKKYYPNYSYEEGLIGECNDARLKLIHGNYWDVVILWKPSFRAPVFLGWFSQFDEFQSILVADDIENTITGFAAGINSCLSSTHFFDEYLFKASSRFFRDPNLN